MARMGGAALLVLFVWAPAAADQRGWSAQVTIGWAGLVDDATKNYLVVGGGVRRYLSPRLSIGPEIAWLSNSRLVTDRLVMVTGNAVVDLKDPSGRLTPFLVGGAGISAGRDRVAHGPFHYTEPAFTAGGGVRARLNDALSAAAEYRIGWELHQRLTGALGVHW